MKGVITVRKAIPEKLRKQIYSVLRANQLKMMEISGVDVKRLLEQQAETAAKMAEIAEKIGAGFREAAPGVAELHCKAMVSHYKLQARRFSLLDCIVPPLEEALDCDKSIVLQPVPPIEDLPPHLQPKGEADCDLAENICRPYLELHGLGSGVPVSGTVTCGLVFSQKGEGVTGTIIKDGHYRIRALTQASGYQLLQLWSSGCGGGIPATIGHLKITARLCVSQLFDESWSDPIDLTATTYPDAVHLNRYIDLWTDLREGISVDIKVELKIDAGIDGSGQCFADLGTIPYFYFKVPEVTICRSLLEAVQVAPDWNVRRGRRYIPWQAVKELLEKYGVDLGPPELP